jgi:hypothetical protein
MGFLFRVEQIACGEENTVLTGHLISGTVDWHQRVEIQIEADMRTAFTAPLRGVASAEETGLAIFDPSFWEKVLALPLSISREKQIDLILDGVPLSRDLPVPAIAVGVDAATPTTADRLETAFQPADMPAWSGANFGVPVREYPYQISRRGMLLFAPWGMFFVFVVASLVFAAYAVHRGPGQTVSYGRLLACVMLGFFDVLFLYLSIKMLLAKPAPLVVTTSGIMLPVVLPGYSSQSVYVSFAELDDMLEYWHQGAVQMVKLKTARGILHLNGFLMQTAHFEELRRLLWRRIHEKRQQDKSQTCAAT